MSSFSEIVRYARDLNARAGQHKGEGDFPLEDFELLLNNDDKEWLKKLQILIESADSC